MNSFRATMAAWLGASTEVEMVFAGTGLLGEKCAALRVTIVRRGQYKFNALLCMTKNMGMMSTHK